jgi:hypothetical protein
MRLGQILAVDRVALLSTAHLQAPRPSNALAVSGGTSKGNNGLAALRGSVNGQ